MQATETTSQPAPKRRRGRPAGSRDTKPRKRRGRAELAAVPAAPVRPIRETDIQRQFIRWLDGQPAPDMPGMKLGQFAYAIPNGVWIPAPDQHQRMRIIMTMRRMGLRKGYPDIAIDLPRHGRPGARLELKRDAMSAISPEQMEWLERLRSVGYFAELCPGIEAATDAVRRYLAGEPPLAFPWEEHVLERAC